MLDYRMIEEAISEIESGKLTYEACRNLAALYIIKDKMDRCSCVKGTSEESEFIESIREKPVASIIPILDDLMCTVRMLSPKTYKATINSLKSIEAG